MDSILTSIKGMLGIVESYTHFDNVIISHINSVFADLAQMGVGPSDGFHIENADSIWDDFLGESILLNSVKSYMNLRVKVLFDANSMGSATMAAYERQISQWEWRLNVAAESTENTENT